MADAAIRHAADKGIVPEWARDILKLVTTLGVIFAVPWAAWVTSSMMGLTSDVRVLQSSDARRDQQLERIENKIDRLIEREK